MTLFRKLTWVYVIVGVGALGVVAIAGQTSYGAKLSLSIGPLTIQPSEFVKIIFVMFIASMLYQRQDFHQVMVTSIFSEPFCIFLPTWLWFMWRRADLCISEVEYWQ